jgi:hypothetical protein
LIVDSSALVAFFVASDPAHRATTALFTTTTEELIVPPYVVAEVDHLITGRHGVHAELDALRALADGSWDLTDMRPEDVAAAIKVMEKYDDQTIGVADASIVVLAKRFGTKTVATLDRRHFEVLRPLDGGRFTIVP